MLPRNVNIGAAVACSIVILGFIGLCVLMLLHAVQDSPSLQILLGAMAAKFSDAVQYFTGSTASSKAKDATIAEVAKSQTGNAQ